MNFTFGKAVGLLCFMTCLIIGTLTASAQEYDDNQPLIRVGLWDNQANIIISADSDFSLVDGDTNEIVDTFKAKERVVVSALGTSMSINGKPRSVRRLSIKQAGTADAYIEVNRRHYRGAVEIHHTNGKSGLTVVNTLPLEEYVYGVIAKEISPEWPLEAVKAQAVAARTYALYNLNKHNADGYDICATTDCQVYGGRDSEAVRATRAVDETRGLVIEYHGKIIPAYFHSSSGGYTENSENVWESYVPYLRGVKDYDQHSPAYKWEKKFTPGELQARLAAAGYNIGTLQAIELSPLSDAPMSVADRGVSGRVKTIRFLGTSGMAQMSGLKLRSLLQLNSTLFDVKVFVPVPKDFEVQITDSYGDREQKKVTINLPPVQEKGLITDKDNIHRLTGRAGEIIVLHGFGWGHGLGLSQWGAKAMAEQAPQGDPEYFKEILRHYYLGVDIQKLY